MAPIRKQPRRSCAAAVAGSSTAQQNSSDPVFLGTGIDSASEERDWAKLLPELVRKIGDHLLLDDVTEYIRLRAVCQPWRRNTDDPSALEPRFCPRNWLMVHTPGDELGRNGVAERFVNVRTGASMWIRLPTPKEYYEYNHHGNTEGLLILSDPNTDSVCLLNPLTMAFTVLPSITAIHCAVNSTEFKAWHIKAAGVLVELDKQGRAQPPNVVLSLTSRTRTVLVYARPGDAVWRVIDTTSCTDELEGKLPTIKGGLSVWGRFYIPTRSGDVLRVVLEPQPRLTFFARQTGTSICSGLGETSYIVPSCDDRKDLMFLVRKRRGIRQTYSTWEVDLNNVRLIRITALRDMTVLLPSITLRSSAFPNIEQNRVCSKTYAEWLLHQNLII